MQIPLFNYLLTLTVVYLGLPLGVLLARIAEEELLQFKRFILFFKKYLGYKYHKTRQIISAGLFFVSSYNLNAFIVVASLIFLYYTRIGILYYDENVRLKNKKRKNITKFYLTILREDVLFIILSILLSLVKYMFVFV